MKDMRLKTLENKIKRGEVEMASDISKFGWVDVRDLRTGKCVTIKVLGLK